MGREDSKDVIRMKGVEKWEERNERGERDGVKWEGMKEWEEKRNGVRRKGGEVGMKGRERKRFKRKRRNI